MMHVHKTLETSKEHNAHHYTFMCFVTYSIYFETFRGEKTLFPLESSRNYTKKA